MGLIDYRVASPDEVDVEELLEFYRRQQHETTDSVDKLRRMLELSDCVAVAREDGRLIGIARGVADGVRGYLAECKLDPAYQGPGAVTRREGRVEHDVQGIAREMASRVLDRLREMGVESILVTAHGTEEDFCAELGFRRACGAVAMQMDVRMLNEAEASASGEVKKRLSRSVLRPLEAAAAGAVPSEILKS